MSELDHLPDEVLVEVFLCLLPGSEEESDPDAFSSRITRVGQLSLVCTRFDRLISDRPSEEIVRHESLLQHHHHASLLWDFLYQRDVPLEYQWRLVEIVRQCVESQGTTEDRNTLELNGGKFRRLLERDLGDEVLADVGLPVNAKTNEAHDNRDAPSMPNATGLFTNLGYGSSALQVATALRNLPQWEQQKVLETEPLTVDECEAMARAGVGFRYVVETLRRVNVRRPAVSVLTTMLEEELIPPRNPKNIFTIGAGFPGFGCGAVPPLLNHRTVAALRETMKIFRATTANNQAEDPDARAVGLKSLRVDADTSRYENFLPSARETAPMYEEGLRVWSYVRVRLRHCAAQNIVSLLALPTPTLFILFLAWGAQKATRTRGRFDTSKMLIQFAGPPRSWVGGIGPGLSSLRDLKEAPSALAILCGGAFLRTMSLTPRTTKRAIKHINWRLWCLVDLPTEVAWVLSSAAFHSFEVAELVEAMLFFCYIPTIAIETLSTQALSTTSVVRAGLGSTGLAASAVLVWLMVTVAGDLRQWTRRSKWIIIATVLTVLTLPKQAAMRVFGFPWLRGALRIEPADLPKGMLAKIMGDESKSLILWAAARTTMAVSVGVLRGVTFESTSSYPQWLPTAREFFRLSRGVEIEAAKQEQRMEGVRGGVAAIHYGLEETIVNLLFVYIAIKQRSLGQAVLFRGLASVARMVGDTLLPKLVWKLQKKFCVVA